MLGALAGLPSLGGLGGGFGGGALPLLGFGLLSTLTSQLTTQSFLGNRTSIPDLNFTDVSSGNGAGNITSAFGNYSGSAASSNGLTYPYGNDPRLQAGPADFQNWHQWATGGVQPPLALASFGGQSFPYTGPVYGAAGAYGAASYGAAGGYGASSYGAAGGHGMCSVYASPPIFANYAPSTAYASTQYGAASQFVAQQSYGQQAHGYTPAPQDAQRNTQFDAWAGDALARFNANNTQISSNYQASQSSYGQVTNYNAQFAAPATSMYPRQPSYGTGAVPAQNNAFDAWSNTALAQFYTQRDQYQATQSYSPPPIAYAQQASYGAQQSGYVDVTMQIPVFQQLPAYGSYQNTYQNLQASGSCSYGAYNLGWSYPCQPAPYYQQASSSYTALVLQNQTSYGYGGPPRPAPCSPPAYPPRPQPPAPEPAPYVPPVSVTPQVETPPAVTPPAPRTRVGYPLIPHTNNDPGPSAAVLGARLTGDPNKISAFTTTNPAPIHNQDSLRFDRIGAYFVMQQDPSLRYNVDSGKFFRTYSTGETKDVMDMAQVSQMLRQEHPDHYGRVGQLLSHLPNDEQLFGARTASAAANPTRAHGATPINPGIIPPVQTPILPPFQRPNLPTFGGIPNSGGALPALDQLVANRDAGRISGNDFNLELIKIAAQTGAINTNPLQAKPATAPFTVTAHRYWDSASGAYSDVSEILIQGGENPNDVERRFNPNKQTTLVVNKDNVPLGNPMRVTVSWENGQSRVWDYQVADQKGSDVDVFSPLG